MKAAISNLRDAAFFDLQVFLFCKQIAPQLARDFAGFGYYGRETAGASPETLKLKINQDTMKIAIGSDHAGFELKLQVLQWLEEAGHETIDLGTHNCDAVDYPDFAAAVGRAVVEGKAERGIVVCGSGAGAAIAANKVRGVRATLAHDTYTAAQCVEHDDANVITFGARVIGSEVARGVVKAFVNAEYTAEERHARRLGKILKLEEEF